MGHEVFVSYKFSDGKVTKDKIMNAIGKSGHFYNGEKGFCKLEVANSTLKEYLSDMIFGTSVTIVVISPEVTLSSWVNWEIQYSLECHTRNGRTNIRNGILCVIQGKEETAYDWYGHPQRNINSSWAYQDGKIPYWRLPNLIVKNMQASYGFVGRYFSFLSDGENNFDREDYCVMVAESTFMKNPNKYIEEAYRRSRDFENYPSVSRK